LSVLSVFFFLSFLGGGGGVDSYSVYWNLHVYSDREKLRG